MKKLILFAAAAMCACAPKVTVTVENTLDFDRSSELVEIPLDALSSIPLGEGEAYVVKNAAGETVISQTTHDGLLVFRSELGADEKTTFSIGAGAPQKFAVKSTGRFAPERFDDFIWENDRVAFRIYGEALIEKDGPSNGIDALYKRSSEPVLDKWYEDYFSEAKLSYHDDNGTGLDDYKVGRTLGAGGMAPWANFKLFLNSNFTGQERLDAGPLRTTFRLRYPDLAFVDDETVSEMRTFSLDAGSQLTRVKQEFGFTGPMSVAAGFPIHNENPADAVFKWLKPDALIVEEPATPKSDGVYLGVVFPTGVRNVFSDSSSGTPHVLAIGMYQTPEPFVYYTGYGWAKHGDWTADSFASYLENFAAALKTPLVVTIK